MKKMVSFLLAIMLVLNLAVVMSFATDADNILDFVNIYRGINGEYYLLSDSTLYLEIGTTINLYKNLDNDQKELLKKFSNDEVRYLTQKTAVNIPILSPDEIYCLAVTPPQAATQSDVDRNTYYHDFTCEDLKSEYPKFEKSEFLIMEKQSLDLASHIMLPIDYDGEVTLEATAETEHLGIEYVPVFNKKFELEGTVITAVDDGTVRVKMYDADGDRCDLCTVIIKEGAPASFEDHIGNTEETIREGLGEAILKFAGDLIFTLSWMVSPIVIPITVIFGIFL